MPRSPRIEFAGAIYHVMNRGDRLEPIFEDDADRQMFLKTLGETCRSAGWHAHSFVLMRNHYHLLVETRRATLVKGMQYLNSTYTRRYNVRHRKWGRLFAGRYKALLVDSKERGYFLTVSDYIHLNPVRAGKVRNLEELLRDRWNSAGWLSNWEWRRAAG
jgi:REP element-mobilizing transposase RayT